MPMCTSGASAQSSGADTIAGSTSQHLAGRAAADPESANVGKAKNLRQTRQPVGKKKGTAHASSLMQAGKHKLTTDSSLLKLSEPCGACRVQQGLQAMR